MYGTNTVNKSSAKDLLGEGDEGSYLHNYQSNFVIALHTLSLLFCHCINAAATFWADMSLHLSLAIVLPVKVL